MARLWKVIDGEPFMVNPALGILGSHAFNPRRKRGTRKARRSLATRRRTGRAHMAWVRSFRAKSRRRSYRRRGRRNPFPVAGVVANPHRRRRRSSYRRRNPVMRYRRRRHGRRNPSIMGLTLPPLQSVLYAGVGFAGVPMAEGFISRFVPSIGASTAGRYAIRIGAVLGLGMLAKMILGREQGKMVAIGGGAYVLISAIREFAPGVVPGLSGYTMPTLGAYTSVRRPSLAAPAFGAQASAGFAPRGAQNVVAARFRRFQ